MANMGENGPGKADWFNNITLNSRLYGDSNTPVVEDMREAFLQTLAHEMLHVNENPAQFFLSTLFRMGNPAGYFHRLIDQKADAIVTPQLVKQFSKALKDGDTGCACIN